ncbi:unnamed protein product [Dovyalis caffra]|uniref:Core Histone H2A/H2B/H3 domain-containing protein n=1 Tax=Dovyalis caffra TaxID=77055 RepID=A0AAV1SQE8_9ROSI|nr:unnamed protein product [Dovyalis caffra]
MARTKTQATRKRSRSQRQSEAAPSTPRAPKSLRTRSTANTQQEEKAPLPSRDSISPGNSEVPEDMEVRMITQKLSHEVNRWTAEALVAIQEERIFLVHLFEDGMLCAIHGKRVTLSDEKGFGAGSSAWSKGTTLVRVSQYKSISDCNHLDMQLHRWSLTAITFVLYRCKGRSNRK